MILFSLSLMGCGPQYATNDEIIEQTKKCTDAGLKATEVVDLWDGRTVSVQCVIPEKKSP